MAVNPLSKIAKADEQADRRRIRRALTEDELLLLLDVAVRRPLAERGRLIVHKPNNEMKRQCDIRRMLPLTLQDLDSATCRGRERLARNPKLIAKLEVLGQERALVYKTLVLTGLRRGELASLRGGEVLPDAPTPCFVLLVAADEKNREGSTIPLRADLVADLRQWLT